MWILDSNDSLEGIVRGAQGGLSFDHSTSNGIITPKEGSTKVFLEIKCSDILCN